MGQPHVEIFIYCMAKKFYSNKILWFASKSFIKIKLMDFDTTKAQFHAWCHGDTIVIFHSVYKFKFYSSATSCNTVN